MNTEIKIMNILTIIAIVVGPIIAVIITIWSQNRKEKIANKFDLFINLMAYRKSNPPHIDYAKALNLVDVVYAKDLTVLKLWHEYYDLLHTKTPNFEAIEDKQLDLLSEMAQSLGYKNLKQTDIGKFYTPIAHGYQNLMNERIQVELLDFLKNVSASAVTKKEENKT